MLKPLETEWLSSTVRCKSVIRASPHCSDSQIMSIKASHVTSRANQTRDSIAYLLSPPPGDRRLAFLSSQPQKFGCCHLDLCLSRLIPRFGAAEYIASSSLLPSSTHLHSRDEAGLQYRTYNRPYISEESTFFPAARKRLTA